MSDRLTSEQIDFLSPALGMHGDVRVTPEAFDRCQCCDYFTLIYSDRFFSFRIATRSDHYVTFYFRTDSAEFTNGTDSAVAFYTLMSKLSPNITNCYDLATRLGLINTISTNRYRRSI